MKLYLFYLKENEDGEDIIPPSLYAVSDSKETSDLFKKQRKASLFDYKSIKVPRNEANRFMDKNKDKILTDTTLVYDNNKQINCTLTWEEEKASIIFHKMKYFEALRAISIDPRYFSEKSYKILDMVEYREIYDIGQMLQFGMYVELMDYEVNVNQFKLMARQFGWMFREK